MGSIDPGLIWALGTINSSAAELETSETGFG